MERLDTIAERILMPPRPRTCSEPSCALVPGHTGPCRDTLGRDLARTAAAERVQTSLGVRQEAERRLQVCGLVCEGIPTRRLADLGPGGLHRVIEAVRAAERSRSQVDVAGAFAAIQGAALLLGVAEHTGEQGSERAEGGA